MSHSRMACIEEGGREGGRGGKGGKEGGRGPFLGCTGW